MRQICLLSAFVVLSSEAVADLPTVAFQNDAGAVQITIGDKPFARYVFEDKEILRPYLGDVHAPNGMQITRNNPPVKGKDIDDHPTFHPGIWLAFGDLNGADFWRNRGRVRHVKFVEPPNGGAGTGRFAVRNAFEADGRTVCIENCRLTIQVLPEGYLLTWDSAFSSPDADFYFGDQEEMGLGIRIHTPLAVVKGGSIVNSDFLKDEKGLWGKQADWCLYKGTIDDRQVGAVLMPDPKNFRRSWFHARNYGLLVANPFGQNAFTKGEKSKVVVKKGESFRIRFGILLCSAPSDEPFFLSETYEKIVKEGQVLNPK